MEEISENPKKLKILRCIDWLQKQNNENQKKFLQNTNDIEFILQTHSDRRNFFLSTAEDDASVPAGVDGPPEPQAVPIHLLRKRLLRMECEWKLCTCYFTDYTEFQKHVANHATEVHIIERDDITEFYCLWDVCGHKSTDYAEIFRHINYHAYHARLLAIGFNGRASLNLNSCKKDSGKRNEVPTLITPHCCLWTGCTGKFNSIQVFFDHVKQHVHYADNFVCSWAGCGDTFPRRSVLTSHVRSHTQERLIACYHCGQHFANNRKLCDHLRRQNPLRDSAHMCSVCQRQFGSAYLLQEHARQHVSAAACTLCDMSAPSQAALAMHVRYRHLQHDAARTHSCTAPGCEYRAVTKSDLNKHINRRHNPKKRKPKKLRIKSELNSDDDSSEEERKPEKVKKKYACHMCPENNFKVFNRGTTLTSHLVKVHEAQWPFGHSRFRYQISEDGMYRLTTTRYEVFEISKKIVDGYSGPKGTLINDYEFNVKKIADPTENTPTRIEITFKNDVDDEEDKCNGKESVVEIEMCDVDDKGNIINKEIITSNIVNS